jgi:signal transduction histidine kinase
VRVAVAGGARGEVAASVVDDGQGIPPEHLHRIFDRLYQVGDALRPRDRGDGLGLGLAIVKAIVEAHGGRIGVSSRVGRGTRFRFSLPVAGAPPGAPPAAAAREPAVTTRPG